MKRVVILLVFLMALSIIPIQSVSAGPLPQKQLQLYRSGINYFDITEAVPYRPDRKIDDVGGAGEVEDGTDSPLPGGVVSPGGSIGNVDPINWSDFDNAIQTRLRNTKIASPGSNCFTFSNNFVKNYTTLSVTGGLFNGGRFVSDLVANNSTSGLYVRRNASSIGSVSPKAVGIFSTYAASMTRSKVCTSDSVSQALFPKGDARYGLCGHTGVIVKWSDGSVQVFDTLGSGPYGYSTDNNVFNDFFLPQSHSSFYWFAQTELK